MFIVKELLEALYIRSTFVQFGRIWVKMDQNSKEMPKIVKNCKWQKIANNCKISEITKYGG